MASVTLRLLWGFPGNGSVNWRGLSAALSNWPSAIRIELARRRGEPLPEGYVEPAHNPLAAAAYVAIFVLFVGQSVTGLLLAPHLLEEAAEHRASIQVASLATDAPALIGAVVSHGGHDDDDDDDHDGAKGDDDEGEEHGKKEGELFKELHELGLWWLGAFLLLHVGGIAMDSRARGRNLFREMLPF